MNRRSYLIQRALWGLLLGVVLAIGATFILTLLPHRAPPLPDYGAVADFHLTNQFNQPVSLSDLRGQVWVGDIIFTRCPGPCLSMTRKMKALRNQLPAGVKLVSLTADPEYDTPSILKKYADNFKANSGDWLFLTGPKPAVYEFAMKGLKLAVQDNGEPQPEENQFIHSTRFVLVDQAGHLRSVSFDGTDAHSVPDLVRAVRQLLQQGEP